jgi:hypothetical protein
VIGNLELVKHQDREFPSFARVQEPSLDPIITILDGAAVVTEPELA